MGTPELVDRCLRALSPYDCRRHYAALLARHSSRSRGTAAAPVPADLVSELSRAQRRGVEAGLRDAIRAVERRRLLAWDTLREERAAAAAADPAARNLHRQDLSRERTQRTVRTARGPHR